ncbi:MAG: DUF4363 family protein [Ruminococcus sp.]|nr:DUF4363 family protein [Ruminococcus sp.]
MNRAIVCVILMTVLAAGSVLALVNIRSGTEDVISLIDEVIESSEAGSSRTDELIAELEEEWQQEYKRMSFFVQAGILNDISNAVAKLSDMHKSGSDGFTAECRGIREWVRLIFETQLPRMNSLF